MYTAFKQFSALHSNAQPLLIGNVWNVQSAKIFEKIGFEAIATSSSAVAETLGYEDGEVMSFEEYLFVIRRIASSVSIPVSVDLEAGYGNSVEAIVNNIQVLQKIGIAGINIEDSMVKAGERTITDPHVFADKLSSICRLMASLKINIFVNVRSDVFLLGMENPLVNARHRIQLYENTGVHGFFFPCVTKLEDIATLTGSTILPVNVMCMPELPPFTLLQHNNVKRISMGNFLNTKIYRTLEMEAAAIVTGGNFSSVFN